METGWTMDTSTTSGIDNGCASRPCAKTEVCVPMGSPRHRYNCLPLPADCGHPKPIVNGSWSVTGTLQGNMATLTCDPQYEVYPQDTSEFTCAVTSRWTPPNAACLPICSNGGRRENGASCVYPGQHTGTHCDTGGTAGVEGTTKTTGRKGTTETTETTGTEGTAGTKEITEITGTKGTTETTETEGTTEKTGTKGTTETTGTKGTTEITRTKEATETSGTKGTLETTVTKGTTKTTEDSGATKTVGTEVTSGTTKTADWVEKSCTVNSECPATQSVCYEGLCLCTPGYYYSISQNTCLTSCAQHDLRRRFFKYANAYISLNNLLTSPSETVAQCFDMCLTDPICRTVDYDYTYGAGVMDYCSTQNVSALDVPANDWNSGRVGFDHYQRACV